MKTTKIVENVDIINNVKQKTFLSAPLIIIIIIFLYFISVSTIKATKPKIKLKLLLYIKRAL